MSTSESPELTDCLGSGGCRAFSWSECQGIPCNAEAGPLLSFMPDIEDAPTFEVPPA